MILCQQRIQTLYDWLVSFLVKWYRACCMVNLESALPLPPLIHFEVSLSYHIMNAQSKHSSPWSKAVWQVLECYLTASYSNIKTFFVPCCSKHISTVANTKRRRRSNALRCNEVSTGAMWLWWSSVSSEVLKALPEKSCSLSQVDFRNL